ncbi:MAG: hypothetical protein EB060_05940 [Proteobacteria bacterium]|nr:hypothetical protein [Pseudomonadota bacterium]
MTWQKMGNIFDPRTHTEWAGSHAQVPAVLVKKDVIRIYYADRFKDNRSFTTFLDVDRKDPSKVVYFHKKPLLDFGKPGTFDDNGIMPATVVENGKQVYLYYSGWNQGISVPYRNSTGLAISEDGGQSFTRAFEGPVMERNAREPYLAVTPWVIKEDKLWRAWYISGLRWEKVDGKFEPVYVIKYAQSEDGIEWERPNITSVPQKHEMEAFSHPCVVKRGEKYCMWYCFRDSKDYRDGTGSYRMGYAESKDGIHFTRADNKAGIDVSKEGWDSTMICYPTIVEVDGRLLMFYNGNGFGRTGIGYAVWKE